MITWRLGDTTKSAGHHIHDVKASNINSKDTKKEVYTTGFTPNPSHTGESQAETIKYSLEVFAVLAGDHAEKNYQWMM